MSVLRVVTGRAALRDAYATLPPATARGVVLTMGALHEGHVALIRQAAAQVGPDGHVAVTIFVNPLQFDDADDLARYPRDLEADVALCAREGVDLVFAPPAPELYPDGQPDVTVDPGPLGTLFEGAVRPGHFRGVLTVVHKLLSLTGADVTVFGEKDYQQLVLVRRMAHDLDLDVAVLGAPTAREPDGLARSSRNRRLSSEQRTRAAAVPEALQAGVSAARDGARAALDAVQDVLERAGLTPDYAVLTDPGLGPVPESGPARLLLAVPVGDVRLLDNAPCVLGD